MLGRRDLLWVLPTLLLLATGQETAWGPLLESQVYYAQGDGDNGTDNNVVAPQTVLAGVPLGSVDADTVSQCADACRAAAGCVWFNFCPVEGGCVDGIEPLEYQECQLLAINGTVVPQVLAAGFGVAAIAGFPWQVTPREFPGFTTVPAQGMEGSNYQCPGSVLHPNQCAFRTVVEAAMFCMNTLQCRTVVVYPNGSDSASPLLAVLKSTNLPPPTTLVSPLLYSVTRLDNRPITATYLYDSDGETILPTAEEVASNSSWQGCFVGRTAAIDGIIVATVTAPSPEACCRTCRFWGSTGADVVPINATNVPNTCNCWNYCDQEGGCRYETGDGVVLDLAQGQCQLRFQTVIQPTLAYPAALIAKGPAVPFYAGGPIVTSGPPIPGYTLMPGKGLFSFGRFNCSGSLRPEIQECVLQGSPNQLGQVCKEDSECAGFILKQQGIYGGGNSLGIFKHDTNASFILWNPTGLLYLRNAPYSSSSLSAGAIVGIAVGATVGGLALASVAYWMVRQRRHRGLHEQQLELTGSNGGSTGTPRPADEAAAAAPKIGSPLPTSVLAVATSDLGGSSSASKSESLQQSLSVEELPTGSSTLASGLSPMSAVVLPELVLLVTAHDAAANSTPLGSADGGTSSAPDQQQLLLSAAQLPPGLQEFVLDPSSFAYCRLPGGKLHKLGSGASGTVYKAIYNGEFVAAKEIELGTNPELQRTFVREVVRLHQLRHATVVGFVGVAVTGSKGILLMEHCEGRDLHNALSLMASGTGQRLFGWSRLGRRVAHDVARALNYLHSKGVVHLDVKSSNVLLTASGAAKLGDVGVAVLQTHTFLTGLPALVGTYAWVAPEVLMGQPCTSAVDVFSYGVVLWEICTGECPTRGRLRPVRVPQEAPQNVSDLITRCTSADPAQRPSAGEIMQQLGHLLRRGERGGRTSMEDSIAGSRVLEDG